jgi:hypothetical protein
MVLSAAWCLAFESPMITIEKYLLGGVGESMRKSYVLLIFLLQGNAHRKKIPKARIT